MCDSELHNNNNLKIDSHVWLSLKEKASIPFHKNGNVKAMSA